MCVHVSPILSHLLPHPIPQGCPSASALSTLFHASNLHRSSISHMVIYRFQCYSHKSSHPRLLPESPKVCSLHLCLFCCLTYRVIVTIFLFSFFFFFIILFFYFFPFIFISWRLITLQYCSTNFLNSIYMH